MLPTRVFQAKFTLLFLTCLTLIASGRTEASMPPGLKTCGAGLGKTATTGDTLLLDDGTTVRLADIKAPEYWPGNTPYKSWPHGRRSKEALKELTRDTSLTFFCGRRRQNMFGDLLAHVKLPDGRWLQEVLVTNGDSLFYPSIATPEITQSLRDAEKQAQHHKKGMWALKAFKATNALGPDLRTGWFQTVRGTIVKPAKVRDKFYLNFGDDWRTDFTIEFEKRIEKQLQKQNVSALTLEGASIEVRGWVEWSGGPKIILTHPDQLQILSVSEAR